MIPRGLNRGGNSVEKKKAEDEDVVRLFLQGVAYKVARGEICEIGISNRRRRYMSFCSLLATLRGEKINAVQTWFMTRAWLRREVKNERLCTKAQKNEPFIPVLCTRRVFTPKLHVRTVNNRIGQPPHLLFPLIRPTRRIVWKIFR